MCQFHIVIIVMRTLYKKHQSEVEKVLKVLVKTLKTAVKMTSIFDYICSISIINTFLEQCSDKSNEKGYFPYKYLNVGSVYASLKRYMNYLFLFQQYADLGIEKTTNRLEGLFKELKQKLIIYNELTRKHKIMFIKDFLNRKSW